MNSGKVYDNLLNKMNNDLISIIQNYNITIHKGYLLDKLIQKTFWINREIETYNIKVLKIHHVKTYDYNYWDCSGKSYFE